MVQDSPTPPPACLVITRPTDGAEAARLLQRQANRHGTAMKTRPLRCATDAGPVWASAWALPFRAAAFETIVCHDVLEHVRDDEALVAELARVLRPGGSLFLRVPAAGPLAGLDGYNLYRYLRDVTHRGWRPPETDEIGWRRHYSTGDLAALLHPHGFRLVDHDSRGFAVSDMATLAAMTWYRWARRDERGYQAIRRSIDALRAWELRVPAGPVGTSLSVHARRDSGDASAAGEPQEKALAS